MPKIKVLGLMLVAMFAMSAVAATAASADEFTAEKYPVTLTGERHTANPDKLIITPGTASCAEAFYHGTASKASRIITVTPSYGSCTAFGFPATIDVNECTYDLEIGAGAAETKGSVTIRCPAGKEITITGTSAGTTKCTVHIPGGQTITGVSYTQVGSSGPTREITVTVQAVAPNKNTLKYTHTEGTGLGKCTPGSASNGSFEGAGIVTGEVDGGTEHIGLFLS